MSNIQKQHKISPAIAWLTIQKFIIFYCPLDGEHTTFRGGLFLCFRYVDCLCLLRGQDNDLSLVNGVGVHKTVGVALEDGLVVHQTGICNYIPYILAFFTITLSPFSNCSLETPLNPSPTCSVLYPQPFDFRSFVCISMVVIIVSNTPPFVL